MRLIPLLATAAILAATLAGCSAEPPAEEPVVLPTADLPVAFLPDVALPQDIGAGEPNIAVAPDGTLWVTAPVGGSQKPNVREGGAYLWRSTDGGSTWDVLRQPRLQQAEESPLPYQGAFCSCDADVVVSPDGWVYYSDWWIAGVAPGNYLVEASADGGETWTSNSVPIPQNLVAAMDRQWLVAGEDGFVAIVYSFFGSACAFVACAPGVVPAFGLDRPGQALEAVISRDHGETWADPVPLVPAQDGSAYQVAHPRLRGGEMWMPYGHVPNADGFWRDPSEVRVAIAGEDGSAAEDVLVAEVPEGFDNLWAVQGATDPSTGRSFVAWAARMDDDHSLVWMSWSDDLRTWSAPYAVTREGIHVLPWVDASGGKVLVGWYGTGATGDPLEVPNSAEWFALAAQWNVTADPWLEPPRAATMPVTKVSLEPVKKGPMCPRGAACPSDRELLDYVSMVYDPEGQLHYAFARSQGSDAFVHVASQDPLAPYGVAGAWPIG